MASISLKDLLTIISEEMTKASTENKKSGKEVMTLLLEQRGTDVMITEEMMKTVTGNEESEKKSDDAFA
jgi:AICAR transformylase/IMP cyclohydrolase PurH